MHLQDIHDLSKCSEFYQTLQARPPAIVHGTAWLLVTLLGIAGAWAALTPANLVVRAPGRMRPVTEPTRVFNAGSGETLSASSGGRVVEVHFHEGDVVKTGDVLLRLDTERLDQDLVKKKQALTAGEEEVRQLARAHALLGREHAAARARAEAEVAQAVDEISQEKQKRGIELAEAQADWEQAAYEERQSRILGKAVAEAELVKAVARRRAAEERMAKARLPVPDGRLLVLRRAAEFLDMEYAVKTQEILLKQGARQAAVNADQIELTKLALERKQAVLRAPCDGVVISPDIKVGDVLERGKAVVEIAGQQGFNFEADVASDDVGLLEVGMTVRVKLDAFDFQKYGTFTGAVVFVSPDSSAKAGPTGGQRCSYLVKIRVEGEEIGHGDHRGRVRLGMAGQAEVVIGQESILSLLLKKIRQTISLG